MKLMDITKLTQSPKVQQYGWYVLYALAIIGALCLMTLQLRHAYCADCDTGYYLSISNRISEGYRLYNDVACGYTPLYLYVCAGLKCLFHIPANCYWPYLLMQQLLRIGIALFVYGIAREMKATKMGAYIAACFVCLLLFKEEGTYVLLEVPSTFFGLGGCYTLLHFRNKNIWHEAWIGCIVACAYLCKQYGLGYLPLALLLIFCYTNRTEWWKRILLLLAGFVLPIVAVTVYFGSAFYAILLPTYGTSFLESTEIEYSIAMRLDNIRKAVVNSLTNYAIPVVLATLLSPFAIKQKEWRMFVFALCGYLGFSLQYYFTLTPALHYAFYMMPFVALMIAWISKIDAPKWILAIAWLGIAYCFVQRSYRLVERCVPVWQSELYCWDIRTISAYCEENIPPQSKVFLECYGYEAVYFNAPILPPMLDKYGYSFGPSGLNYEQALEQLQYADYAILDAPEEENYYFSKRLFQQLEERYPADTVNGVFIFNLRQ